MSFTTLPCAGPLSSQIPAFSCTRPATIGFMVTFGVVLKDIAVVATCQAHQNVIGTWLHQRFGECSYGDLAAANLLPKIAQREGRNLTIPTSDELLSLLR